jgi:hypothetical protein
MDAVAEQATPYGTFVLSAKVAMAAGDANRGIVSAENGTRAAYYFRGTAIDDCAAAEHQANPGDIILSRAT